jgi:hypothetical protein
MAANAPERALRLPDLPPLPARHEWGEGLPSPSCRQFYGQLFGCAGSLRASPRLSASSASSALKSFLPPSLVAVQPRCVFL